MEMTGCGMRHILSLAEGWVRMRPVIHDEPAFTEGCEAESSRPSIVQSKRGEGYRLHDAVDASTPGLCECPPPHHINRAGWDPLSSALSVWTI